MHVLDMGSGGGRDAIFLAMQGHHVTAIDNKKQVIQRAELFAENYQLHMFSFTTLWHRSLKNRE